MLRVIERRRKVRRLEVSDLAPALAANGHMHFDWFAVRRHAGGHSCVFEINVCFVLQYSFSLSASATAPSSFCGCEFHR